MTSLDRFPPSFFWSSVARDAWMGVLEDLGYTVFDDSDPSPPLVVNGVTLPQGFAWSLDGGEGGKEGRDFSRTFATEQEAILDAVRSVREGGDPDHLRTVNAAQVRIEQAELQQALATEPALNDALRPGPRARL